MANIPNHNRPPVGVLVAWYDTPLDVISAVVSISNPPPTLPELMPTIRKMQAGLVLQGAHVDGILWQILPPEAVTRRVA